MTTPNSDMLLLSQATGLDPQTLREFAEHVSQQLEIQSIDFAPALEATRAFFPGGMYNRTDPETGERLPPPVWGDMTRDGTDGFMNSLLEGMLGGDLGGIMEGMTQKMDAFLQFVKDLAAAANEALNSLSGLGEAISAFAELAAGAAASIAALLQARVKSQEDEAPPIQLPGRIGEDFDVAAQRFLAGDQPPPAQLSTSPPLLENAATWVSVIVEKFEPILQKMCDLVQQCVTGLSFIQVQLMMLPSMLPQEEEKGFWSKVGDWFSGLLMLIAGAIITALSPFWLAITTICVAILAALSYLLDWIVTPSGNSSLSTYRDEKEKIPGQGNITYLNEPIPGPEKSTPNYLEASINSKQKFAWPYAETLSAAATVPPGMGDTNNYYSNCNNNQTVNASVPPDIATPDLVAESIVRELKTLGMNYDYAIRG